MFSQNRRDSSSCFSFFTIFATPGCFVFFCKHKIKLLSTRMGPIRMDLCGKVPLSGLPPTPTVTSEALTRASGPPAQSEDISAYLCVVSHFPAFSLCPFVRLSPFYAPRPLDTPLHPSCMFQRHPRRFTREAAYLTAVSLSPLYHPIKPG